MAGAQNRSGAPACLHASEISLYFFCTSHDVACSSLMRHCLLKTRGGSRYVGASGFTVGVFVGSGAALDAALTCTRRLVLSVVPSALLASVLLAAVLLAAVLLAAAGGAASV